MSKKDYSRIEDILNNPARKSKLKNFIDEAVRCKQSIADKNEDMKILATEAAEQVNVDPKLFRQLVTLYFKNSFAEKQAEISALESAIEMLVVQTTDNDAD